MDNIDKIFPPLYKKNKNGSFQIWKLWTSGADIVSEHGKVDGKQQQSRKTAKGKSIGKKNETTAAEQAKLTAQSMWTKKKDKGYFESMHAAENELVFLPMLAHDMLKMSEKKIEQFFKQVLYLQPKMDGVRCLARWNGDKIQLLSRGGKEYIVPHIADALEAVIKPGQVLDGEIYIHGLLRQDIYALVKKHREKEYEDTGFRSADLQFWIYDTFNVKELDKPFKERLYDLKGLNLDGKLLRQVFTTHVTKRKHMRNIHKSLPIHKGFEGTILRTAEGPYELGHRSHHLIKYKDFIDEEYAVVGFGEGEGKFKGCVIWECITPEEKRFNVVPKGTLKQKRAWFKEGNKYIGELMTVKYQSLTKDGIPEFPVGLGFRLPEDM